MSYEELTIHKSTFIKAHHVDMASHIESWLFWMNVIPFHSIHSFLFFCLFVRWCFRFNWIECVLEQKRELNYNWNPQSFSLIKLLNELIIHIHSWVLPHVVGFCAFSMIVDFVSKILKNWVYKSQSFHAKTFLCYLDHNIWLYIFIERGFECKNLII